MHLEQAIKVLDSLGAVPGQLARIETQLSALPVLLAAATRRPPAGNGVRDFHDFASLDAKGLALEARAMADAIDRGDDDPAEVAALLRAAARALETA